jgi:predicted outer membrane repeat protein
MSKATEGQAPARAPRLGNSMLAVVLTVVITAAGGVAAQASAAAGRVPCSPAALSVAISGAASGATVSLTSGCSYVLTAALPTVTQDLTIIGNGATLTRSTAPGTPAFTILPVTGGNLTVGDLNFRNGGGSDSLNGGAIDDTGSGQLTITAGTFTGNSAGGGGAIASVTPYPGVVAPVISGAVFTGNSAEYGGAIYSNSFIINCSCDGTFRDNTATGDGGAIFNIGYIYGGIGGTFAGNAAGGDGGAVVVDDYQGGDGVGGAFRGNHAGGDGGAVYVEAGADLGVGVDGFIAWNTAGVDGGAIYGGSDTYVWGRIIGNRAAGDGGAVDMGPGSDGYLTGATVTANRAAAGGGIYDTGPDSGTSLESSTVTGNRPDNCEPLASVTGCTTPVPLTSLPLTLGQPRRGRAAGAREILTMREILTTLRTAPRPGERRALLALLCGRARSRLVWGWSGSTASGTMGFFAPVGPRRLCGACEPVGQHGRRVWDQVAGSDGGHDRRPAVSTDGVVAWT